LNPPGKKRLSVAKARQAIAAHEAAHAVAFAAYGLEPLNVTIRSDNPGYSGRAVARFGVGADAPQCDIEKLLIASIGLVAGHVGERLVARSTRTGAAELAYVMAVCRTIERRYGVQAMRAMHATLSEAEACLMENIGPLRKLCKALTRRRACTGRRLSRCLRDVKPRPIMAWTEAAKRPRYGDPALVAILSSAGGFALHMTEAEGIQADSAEPEQPAYAEAARQAAGEVIARHERIILKFSGGKDSLACLHLVRPWWDRITVVWVNTGAAYPETIEQMRQVRELVPHFIEVRSDQPGNIATMGWPADVVPVRNTITGQYIHPGRTIRIQSYVECCAANRWFPMHQAIQELGATLVIRGQREDDLRKAPVHNGYEYEGVSLMLPIEAWTEEQVRGYLDSQGVALPEYYAYVNKSLDCWSCTAFADEDRDLMLYTRDKHPELWKELRSRLEGIVAAIKQEVQPMEGVLADSELAERQAAGASS